MYIYILIINTEKGTKIDSGHKTSGMAKGVAQIKFGKLSWKTIEEDNYVARSGMNKIIIRKLFVNGVK